MRARRLTDALVTLSLLAAAPGCIESYALRGVDAAPDADAALDAAAALDADAATDVCTVDGAACSTPPRPIAPLSTATVTSRRPTLRWALTSGDGARVDLCRDRALTAGCVPFDATGTSGAPAADLAPGVWFWRLTTRLGGAATGAAGPTWQFTVGVGARAMREGSWGSTLDVNGDGYADVAVGTQNSGTAYVYLGGPGERSLRAPPVTLTGPVGSSSFGNAVAGAGDFNGDGRADIAVGAYTSDRAYVYLGGSIGPGATPIPLAGPARSFLGGSVSLAGDVNGDGYADLIVGAHGASTSYVYFGGSGATALRGTPILLGGPARPTHLGGANHAGDLNADGYDDIVMNGGGANLMHVYLGGAGADPALRDATPIVLRGPAGSDYFGSSSAGAGDVDGDGHADFVVGAFRSSTAYVYLGSAGATPFNAMPITLTGSSGSLFGVWVASTIRRATVAPRS